MSEANYAVKASAWKMLDYANRAWAPVDYSGHGKNMQATYTVGNESPEAYWARVRADLAAKRRA